MEPIDDDRPDPAAAGLPPRLRQHVVRRGVRHTVLITGDELLGGAVDVEVGGHWVALIYDEECDGLGKDS